MNQVVRNVLSFFLIGTFAIALTSCATTSSKTAFLEEANKDGDAVVYVYRLRSMVGAVGPIGWSVQVDGKRVAWLKQNAYVVFHLSPGPHTVKIGDANVTPFIDVNIVGVILDETARKNGIFTAESNGVYYFRGSGFSTNFVTKETAMTEIVNMKFDMGCSSLSPCESY
jgi:hypothetical protein